MALMKLMLMKLFQPGNVLLLVCFLLASHITFAAWTPTGNGVDGTIRDMLVFDGKLYVAGNFDYSGANRIDKVAYWDGQGWHSQSSGLAFSGGSSITSIEEFNGQLVAAGYIDSVDGVPVSNVVIFNGTSWEPLGAGFDDVVTDLAVYQDTLFASGYFDQSGATAIRFLAKWDGGSWVAVANYIDDYVYTLAVCDTGLLVGGQFTWINGVTMGKTALYSLGRFYALGQGFNNIVTRLRVCDDTLYACGNFTPVGINTSRGISKYYNNAWNPMPSPDSIISGIYDVVKFNQHLIVCGHFEVPEDIGVLENQQYMPGGGTDGIVYRLLEYNNLLYAGGGFRNIDSVPAMSIASTASVMTNLFPVSNAGINILTFPNPAVQGQDIVLEIPALCSIRNVHLLNISGHEIPTDFFLVEPNKIRFRIYESGMMIVKVNEKNIQFVRKIIVL